MAGAEAHQGINLHTTDESEGQPACAATPREIFGAAATAGASFGREGQRDDPVRPSHLPAAERTWAVGQARGTRPANPAAASHGKSAAAGRMATSTRTPLPLDHASYIPWEEGLVESLLREQTAFAERLEAAVDTGSGSAAHASDALARATGTPSLPGAGSRKDFPTPEVRFKAVIRSFMQGVLPASIAAPRADLDELDSNDNDDVQPPGECMQDGPAHESTGEPSRAQGKLSKCAASERMPEGVPMPETAAPSFEGKAGSTPSHPAGCQ